MKLPQCGMTVMPLTVFCSICSHRTQETCCSISMQRSRGHCVTAALQESDLRLELVHAPLVDAIEELDWVEQPHGHLVCPQPPLVWLALIGLGIVELLDLGMEPQPLGGQHCTAPIPRLFAPKIIYRP